MFPHVTELYVSKTPIIDKNNGVRDENRVEWIRWHADETLKGIFSHYRGLIGDQELNGLMKCPVFLYLFLSYKTVLKITS